MNFRVWKKIKKQLSFTKEKEEATLRPKRDDESKEERHSESNVQPYKDIQEQSLSNQLPAKEGEEEAATSNEMEPIQDTRMPVEENQLTSAMTTTTSSQDYDQDYILKVLHQLPEQWIRKEMKLHVIADKKDATWITKRVFQDVERGLITAQFTVKESNHKCDITFILKIDDGLASFPSAVTAINPVLSFILTDIKSEAISRRKRKIKDGSN
jgi:hypothetical protein